jgi:hypothetical protein
MRRGRAARRAGARFFALKEFCLCAVGSPGGEEIEAVAVKRQAGDRGGAAA